MKLKTGTREKISRTKSCFFENKKDKPLFQWGFFEERDEQEG